MHKQILEALSPYATELPHLNAVFLLACDIPPQDRPAWAKAQRKNILRDGWFVNTPLGANGDSETVEDHVQHLTSLIKRLLPRDLQPEALKYAEYHDDHETLAHALIAGNKRDLNPLFNKQSYSITSQDKKLIEDTARTIIFESEPGLKAALDAYPTSPSQAARLFSDIDKLSVMWKCVEFVESGKYKYADFQAYWHYWTPENVQQRFSPFISDIYKSELWPKAQKLNNN